MHPWPYGGLQSAAFFPTPRTALIPTSSPSPPLGTTTIDPILPAPSQPPEVAVTSLFSIAPGAPTVTVAPRAFPHGTSVVRTTVILVGSRQPTTTATAAARIRLSSVASDRTLPLPRDLARREAERLSRRR